MRQRFQPVDKEMRHLLAEPAAIYQQRRDFVLNRLADIEGLTCHKTEGAFYLLPNISNFIRRTTANGRRINNDTDSCMALMDEHHVATVQGAAYGLSPFVQLSYATNLTMLEQGCDRIAELCTGMR